MGSLTLVRKALSVDSAQVSADGISWSNPSVALDSVKNEVNVSFNAGDIVIVNHQAAPYVTEPSTNSPILGGESGLSGSVQMFNWYDTHKSIFAESLIGKVLTNNASGNNSAAFRVTSSYVHLDGKIYDNSNYYAPAHTPINSGAPANNSPAVKALTYAVSNNQQVSLNYAWNELAHDGSDWGDDGVLVIADTGTYTNLNGTELKCGTNTLTKPLGWTKNRARVGEQNEGVDL